MAFTTPPTFAPGAVLTAAQQNILSDDINYLYAQSTLVGVSGCRVTFSGSLSTSSGVYTDVSWDTESIDVGNYITVTSASIVVPASAVPSGYTNILLLLTAKARFANDAVGVRFLRFLKDGSVWGSTSTGAVNGDTTDMTLTDFMTAVAGTVIKVQVAQSSGGTLAVDQLQANAFRTGVIS